MMNNKTISMILLVGGVVLVLASLAADMIGIGDNLGFGYKQIAGTVGGIIAAAIGFYMRRKA